MLNVAAHKHFSNLEVLVRERGGKAQRESAEDAE